MKRKLAAESKEWIEVSALSLNRQVHWESCFSYFECYKIRLDALDDLFLF